jgi:ketosteroid isomerase-like protein
MVSGGPLRIKGFNRVEAIVREDEIEQAVKQFNEAFGLHLPRPHGIQGVPVLSATDFGGFLEVVAPVGNQGPFAKKLERGPGQIGPLVWEIEDIEEARAWLTDHDYGIFYEYDSRTGNEDERRQAVHQLVLDPAQWFGFNVTLMKRYGVSAVRDDTEQNKHLATRFCETYTSADWAALAELLSDDFRWRQPTSSRRQSALLAAAPVLQGDAGYSKDETLDIFRNTVKGCVDERFDLEPVTLTAEGDRVAVEARGYAVNAANGRTYDNRYHHLFRCRAGKITELREYQDTLLLFDVWLAP